MTKQDQADNVPALLCSEVAHCGRGYVGSTGPEVLRDSSRESGCFDLWVGSNRLINWGGGQKNVFNLIFI